MRAPIRRVAGTFVLTGLALGCARVDVRKVPMRANYRTWGDDEQRSADAIPGVRYYLPRPYMSVDKPFTVGGGEYIVSGRVDADGGVVSLNLAHAPAFLKKRFGLLDGETVVGMDQVHVQSTAAPAAGPGLQTQSTGGSKAPAAAPEEDAKPAKEKKETTEESEPPKTKASFAASGNPDTDPVLHVNPIVSVVMLPDFEEQYAVNVDAGLGTATSKIALENGWMMENVETSIDNQEIGKFVFKQIEKFADIAAAVLKDELLPTADEPAADSGVAPQSTALAAGTSVLLRIRYVVQAQPGLYPILKPGEVERWKQVHLQTCEAGSDACANEGDTAVFVPCPPYTVVAKDVYRRVVVTLLTVKHGPAAATGAKPTGEVPVAAVTAKELAAIRVWLAAVPALGASQSYDEVLGGAAIEASTVKLAGKTTLVLTSTAIDVTAAAAATADLKAHHGELLSIADAPKTDKVEVRSKAKP